MTNKIKSFFVIFYLTILFFQVLRNLSPIYFVVVIATVALVLIITAMISPTLKRNGNSFNIYLIFICYTVWVCLWSVAYNPDVDLPNTIGRLFFITSLPIFLIFYYADEDFTKLALRVYVYIYLIAAWSYFYQIQFGPIEWFSDEPMERGSVFRFSTTLGSGNIYGIGLGCALLFTSFLNFNKIIKILIFGSLLIGSIMSMQKAAILNIIIWIFLYIFVFNRKNAKKILFLLTVVVFMIIIYAYVFDDEFFSAYLQEFLFNSIGLNLFDNPNLVKSTVLDVDNIIERFIGVNIPIILSSHNPVTLFLIGIGSTGVGGGMGMPEYPQSHSTYWDLLFMGGIVYLLIYIILIISILKKLIEINTGISRLIFWSIIIYSFNAFAATAAIFHPILSFPVWIGLIVATNSKPTRKCNRIGL
jgi:hypothetical protein